MRGGGRTLMRRFMIDWGWHTLLWTGYVALAFSSWVVIHG